MAANNATPIRNSFETTRGNTIKEQCPLPFSSVPGTIDHCANSQECDHLCVSTQYDCFGSACGPCGDTPAFQRRHDECNTNGDKCCSCLCPVRNTDRPCFGGHSG